MRRICCLCKSWISGGIESFLCNVLTLGHSGPGSRCRGRPAGRAEAGDVRSTIIADFALQVNWVPGRQAEQG